VAAKNKERSLNELTFKDGKTETVTDSPYKKPERFGRTVNVPQGQSGDIHGVRENTGGRNIVQKRCYICNSATHLARQCKAPKTEIQASH